MHSRFRDFQWLGLSGGSSPLCSCWGVDEEFALREVRFSGIERKLLTLDLCSRCWFGDFRLGSSFRGSIFWVSM